jgi:hypothetical protein
MRRKSALSALSVSLSLCLSVSLSLSCLSVSLFLSVFSLSRLSRLSRLSSLFSLSCLKPLDDHTFANPAANRVGPATRTRCELPHEIAIPQYPRNTLAIPSQYVSILMILRFLQVARPKIQHQSRRILSFLPSPYRRRCVNFFFSSSSSSFPFRRCRRRFRRFRRPSLPSLPSLPSFPSFRRLSTSNYKNR